MHCHIIFNPKAANGRYHSQFPEIEQYLSLQFSEVTSSFTERPAHAEELALRAVADGSDIVVAVGGDGTINEVVNGLMQATKKVTMGIIPGGSCNDFIKSVSIPANLMDAAKLIASGVKQAIDVVQAGDRYFVNAAGIGFDVNIAEQIQASPKRNVFSYIKAVSNSIFSYKSLPLDIINGHQTLAPDALMLTIANGRYYGGNFQIAPKANVDDGYFDTILVHDTSGLNRVGLLFKIVQGKHLDAPIVDFIKSTELVVKTQKPVSVQIEGEVFKWPSKEIHFKLLPNALNLLVSS